MIEQKNAGSSGIDLRAIKVMSKELRQELSQSIRKDPDLWNAVNGFGGLSSTSVQSRLQGTITDLDVPVSGAEIIITNTEGELIIVKTNQHGYYKLDLSAGSYMVIVKYQGKQSVEVSVITMIGVTSTLNYNFKASVAKEPGTTA